jgi:hypothetical protein
VGEVPVNQSSAFGIQKGAATGHRQIKAARRGAALIGLFACLCDYRCLLLFHCRFGWTRFDRELQYSCMLAFAQVGEKHDLSVRKLQCIVVGELFLIDLPEDRCRVLRRYLYCFEERADAPVQVAYLTGKREFRARKDADRSAEILHRSEASGAAAKLLRHQFVADFRRARAYAV